jgi:hypothetical protein
VQAAVAIGGFMAYLAEVGAERDDSEQTKTRWAMGYYAAKLGSAPAAGKSRPAPARKSTTAKTTPRAARKAAPARAR